MLVEINPRTFTQITFMSVVYIINAILNAILFGVIVDQFYAVRKTESEQRSELDESNTVMSELK